MTVVISPGKAVGILRGVRYNQLLSSSFASRLCAALTVSRNHLGQQHRDQNGDIEQSRAGIPGLLLIGQALAGFWRAVPSFAGSDTRWWQSICCRRVQPGPSHNAELK